MIEIGSESRMETGNRLVREYALSPYEFLCENNLSTAASNCGQEEADNGGRLVEEPNFRPVTGLVNGRNAASCELPQPPPQLACSHA